MQWNNLSTEKYKIDFQVNGKNINFEIDSGAAVTLISGIQFKCLFPKVKLHKTDIQLYTYCKNKLSVLGLGLYIKAKQLY